MKSEMNARRHPEPGAPAPLPACCPRKVSPGLVPVLRETARSSRKTLPSPGLNLGADNNCLEVPFGIMRSKHIGEPPWKQARKELRFDNSQARSYRQIRSSSPTIARIN